MITKPSLLKANRQGFTLIELIIVIILISVLAVSAFSRFSDNSGFAEYTYQARLISALRNMQTRAMFDTRAGYCFQINLDTSTPAFGPPTLDYVTDTSTSIAATCNTDIDFTNADYLTTSASEMNEEGISLSILPNVDLIGFDSLGRPINNSGTRICSAGCTITLTGETTVAICVESQGYIHVHACE